MSKGWTAAEGLKTHWIFFSLLEILLDFHISSIFQKYSQAYGIVAQEFHQYFMQRKKLHNVITQIFARLFIICEDVNDTEDAYF